MNAIETYQTQTSLPKPITREIDVKAESSEELSQDIEKKDIDKVSFLNQSSEKEQQVVTYDKAGSLPNQASDAIKRQESPKLENKPDNTAKNDSADNISTEDKTSKTNSTNNNELTKNERREVEGLKKRDAEVRAHEQAHANVGGSLTSAPTYDYTVGPDGKRYAVGGEVKIDIGKVEGDPQATLEKARKVRDAALAPANPSAQDRRVAAEAAILAQEAQAEINQERISSDSDSDSDSEQASDQRETKNPDTAEVQVATKGVTNIVEDNEAISAPPTSNNNLSFATNSAQATEIQSNNTSVKNSSENVTAQEKNSVDSSQQTKTKNTDQNSEAVDQANQLLVKVSEQNNAIAIFEATQALYQTLEDQGGINRDSNNTTTNGDNTSLSSSTEPGNLVNTLV